MPPSHLFIRRSYITQVVQNGDLLSITDSNFNEEYVKLLKENERQIDCE